MEYNIILDNTEHDSSLVKAFATYFEKEDFLDVTFVCKGGQKVKAHKLVLSSVSPFLKKLFTDWNEKQDMITLLIPDIDHNILKLVFDFMYEGTMKLSQDELKEFKAILKMLEIKFPGAVVDTRNIKQLAPQQAPPLVKLGRANNANIEQQRNSVPSNSSVMERKKTETTTIINDNAVPQIHDRQPSNPADSLTTDRRLRDPDDDPLNVPDFYFVPTTTSGPTSQLQTANVNIGGMDTVEGGCNMGQIALRGQQGTGTVSNQNIQGVRGNSSRQQSVSSVRKRSFTRVASDNSNSNEAPANVNEEQVQGKRTRNRIRATNSPLVDPSARNPTNTKDVNYWQSKMRKT